MVTLMRSKFLVLIVVLFFLFPAGVLAQGIGEPLGPQPIGTPLPIAPRDYQPTWSAPWPPVSNPPIQPTPVPTVDTRIHQVYVKDTCGLVYDLPAQKLHLPIQSPKINYNLIFTAEQVDTWWWLILDGPYANHYLESCALRVV